MTVEARPGDRKARVAMLVANDVSTDTRVRKMAHDLAEAGLDLTLLAVSSSGEREELTLGSATVIRVPVEDLHSIRPWRRLRRPTRQELIRQIRTEQSEFRNREREVAAEIGWLRTGYYRARAQHRRGAIRSARDMRIQRLIERTRKWPGRIPGGVVRRALRPLLSSSSEEKSTGRMKRTEARMRRRLKASHWRYMRRQDRLKARLEDKRPAGTRTADWRRLLPELHDYEAAFGPEIDALEPDLVHAQDVHLLGVAARAVARSLLAGRNTKLIYDSHEYIQGLGTFSPRVVAAWSALEREYIGRADRVITVSPTISELLTRDYGLDPSPAVVMNIPMMGGEGTASVREAAGLASDVPLLVYSGGVDPTRGVHTLVEATGRLDGVHLAVVARINHSYVRKLQEMAQSGGYEDRLHIVPFVEPQEVVTYLSSATLGVSTFVAGPMNHETTLPNKVFEYMHARLPIVISNCRAMSEFVKALEIGEVYTSEDVDSLTETISGVLENIDKYRAAYERQPDMLERYSWRTERKNLFGVYRDLLGEHALSADIDTLELPTLAPLPVSASGANGSEA